MFRIRSRGLAGIASVLVLMAALVPGAESAMAGNGNGNANVHVSKSVTGAVLSPTVGVALAADRTSVIPGDKVTYTATVTNSGAKLVLKGVFTAEATPAADATVGAYFDDVSTTSTAHCGAGGSNHGHDQWPALAGTAGAEPGFSVDETPPITTGMVLATTPVPADGVTYPSSGDRILGTVIDAGATATWDYTATLDLSPAQVVFLLDPAKVSRIRNTFHVEVSPRGNGAQPATVNTGFCSQLFDGSVTPSGALSNAKVSVSLPSGAPVVFDASTTPGLASIGSGGSVSVSVPYTVPVPDARGASESSAGYLARLAGVDGKVLDAKATLSGDSSGGPVSVASEPVTATEHVPVVTVTKSGPASVDAGKTATYQIGLSNTGSANASDVLGSDSVPAVSPSPVGGVPSTLAAGASASGTATYGVPASQPVGDLTDTASVTWTDGNGNSYGPTTASFTSQVTHPITVAHVILAPTTAGPDVTGTDQVFTVTVTNTDGSPASGVAVTLNVAGANPQALHGTSDASGDVSFTYSGANAGGDTVQASTPGPSGLLTSNTATVSWITPVTPISTTAVHGVFFAGGRGPFTHAPGDTPAFEQDFPTVNFNPPHGTVPHSIGNVGTGTRPFTDVTTDPLGNYSGSVVAQGNGVQAGVGSLFSFDAVFTGSYVVKAAGDVTFDMYSDDGFILGVSGGATRVSGVMQNPPASGLTPFESYPIMGAYNHDSSPTGNTVTVHFPHAGVYPYELDYDECCGGTLSMTMSANGIGLPSAGSLELRPSAPTTASVGAPVNLQVTALSASGTPLAGLPVTLNVDGANTTTVAGTTDAQGNATLSYIGANTGTDQVLVGASISGMPAVSNTSVVTWATNVPGQSSGSGTAPTVTGVSPIDGTIITAPTPITATITPAAGQSIASWSVTATANQPGSVAIPVASGSGNPPATLGVFDPTVLTNGDYTVRISVSGSDGSTRTTNIGVVVHGKLKPGRFKETFTDLNLPVAGIPIGVQRTYDSFDHSTGDFGSGWTMSLSDYQISASRPLGAGGWSQYTASCTLFCTTGFSNLTRRTVTVTAPDGTQQIFDFTPTGGSEVFWGGTAAFTARPGTGTTGKLTVDGSGSFTYNGDGNLYSSGTTIFNPTRYKLTLKNGTVLVLDTTSGLVSESDPSGNTVTVDGTGVHSSSGAAITVHRDTAHNDRITSIDDTAGRSVSYHYNTAGQLTSVTDVNGNVTTYSYDPSSGLFTGAVDGVNKPIITLTYTPDGRVATIAHGSQPATTVSVNVGDRTQTVADPNGIKSTTTTFDDQGDPVSVAVFDGTHTLTTTSVFDAAGRRTDVTDPSGHHQHWDYDESTTSANGNLLAYTDASGRTWKLDGFNSFGQPGEILNPDGGVYLTNTYQSGTPLLASRQVTGQGASTYSYYPNGLVHVASDPGGRTVTYAYNPAGYKTSQADSSGATTLYTPDGAGRDTKITDPAGRAVDYSFNGTGDVTSVTDPGSGDVWSYHYNTRDLLDQATDPTNTHTNYSYNDAGRVISRTDRNGALTTYSYDADGNVTSETRPGGDVTTYSYTPLEQLSETDNASGEDTFTYDPSGNLASQTSCAPQPGHGPCAASTAGSAQPTVTLAYTYHPDGQTATVSGPAGTVSYSDDNLGRLGQVTDPSNQTFTLGYDAAQRLGTMARPNSVDDAYSYNPNGDLTGITSTLGTTTVASTGYGIDPVTGKVTSRTDQTGTTSFGYEADGILASVSPPTGSSQSAEAYTSNNFGDRLTGPTSADTSSYTAGSRLSSDGVNTYTYDAEGNLKTKTVIATNKTTSYTWNADHQLTAVHLPDGSTVTYAYDPLGRRISKSTPTGTTRYVWDHWNVAATYNATNMLTGSTVTLPASASGSSSGQPAQVIEETHAGVHSYPLHDALGSVTGITDQAGTLTSQISYSTYGTPTGTTPATDLSMFTGYQWDPSTGLYYANHRYYNPQTGRFLSEDPISAHFYQPPTGTNPLNPTFSDQTTSAASQNSYLYATGDPTNVTDPTGMSISGEAILLGGMFGALSGGLSGAAGAAETCHGDQACIVETVVANIGIGTLEGAAIAAVPAFGGKKLLGCLIGGLAGSLSGVAFDWKTGADISSWNEVGSAVTSFAIGCAYGAVGGSFEP